MVDLRIVEGPGVDRVNVFYVACGSDSRADPADLVLVAEDGPDIVGATRLCTEHGHLVLRGMVVRQDRQRQGIGRQMLIRLEELMAGRDCYLIGHDYLRSFYGAIGFTPIPADRAPVHLQERLRGYVERGEPEIIMQRSVARSRKEYTASNRAAWNQTAPIHEKRRFEQLLKDFRGQGYSLLDPIETAILKEIGVEGKAVAHLCCNNGRELLSVKNLGAGRCVGFDISEAFLDQGQRLAEAAGLACEFVQTDVHDLPATYDRSFDLVYVTIGALGWLPDVREFFRVAARLLRPGGWLFMYEIHPIIDMFEGSDRGDPPRLQHSYFHEPPFVDTSGLDYYGMTNYESSPSHWFHHKLSDITSGCVDAGLRMTRFQEHGHDISAVFAHFEHLTIKPPLCYTLVARRD